MKQEQAVKKKKKGNENKAELLDINYTKNND